MLLDGCSNIFVALTEYTVANKLESQPIFQAFKSLSIANETAAPPMVPTQHIKAVRDSSAGYFFNVND